MRSEATASGSNDCLAFLVLHIPYCIWIVRVRRTTRGSMASPEGGADRNRASVVMV